MAGQINWAAARAANPSKTFKVIRPVPVKAQAKPKPGIPTTLLGHKAPLITKDAPRIKMKRGTIIQFNTNINPRPAMGVRSLRDMAIAKAASNADSITDFGAHFPFDVALPVLRNVHRAEHLHDIEMANKHFQGKMNDLWIRLIERDAGKHAEIVKHRKIRDGWIVYQNLVKRHEQDKAAHKAQLEARQRAINKSKEENKAILDLDAKICTDNSTKRRHPKNWVVKLQEQRRQELYRVSKPAPKTSKSNAIQKLLANVQKEQKQMGLLRSQKH